MRGTDKGTYQRMADSLLTGQPKPRRIARTVDEKCNNLVAGRKAPGAIKRDD